MSANQVTATAEPRVRQMRVYGVNYDGRTRRIVAARSLSEAARLIGVKYGHMRTYGGETGNHEEIALATSSAGTVFSLAYKSGSAWTRLPNLQISGPKPEDKSNE